MPRLTAVLAAVSIASMTAIFLDWGAQTPMKGGIFSEVGRIPAQLGSSRYFRYLERTAFDWLGLGRAWGGVLTAGFAIAAFVLAWRAVPRESRRPHAVAAPNRWALPVTVASVCLIVVAQATAVSGFPYPGPTRDLAITIQAPTQRIFPGKEADFTVWSSNSSAYQGYGDVILTLELPPGAHLVGAPAYERGSGCTGADTVVCRLDSLSPSMTTPVHFGIRPAEFGAQQITAMLSAQGVTYSPRATLTINSG
jgi:hypothetical protein